MKKILLICLLVSSMFANFKIDRLPKSYNKYDTEFLQAAEKYNIPYYLLKAIALVENKYFHTKIKSPNTNKTHDYGIMQINSIFLKAYDLTEEDLFDPKKNIETAARLLRSIIDKDGFSWDAIGKYHSATPSKKEIWLSRVKTSAQAILDLDPQLSPSAALNDFKSLVSSTATRIKRKAVMYEIASF